MGLDVAELMIAIEEEFNVEIFEAEAQRIETLTDLVDLIEKQVAGSAVTEEQARSMRAQGLLKAREILAATTGVDPAVLTEDTKLETLFPLETRRERWKEIRDRFPPCQIPALESPVLCYLIGFFLLETVAVLLGCIRAAQVWSDLIVGLTAGAILIVSAGGLTVYGIRSRRADFPRSCETVIGFARCILSPTIRLDSEGNAWARPSIEKAVCTIVAESLGVGPEDIKLSTKIIDLY